MNTQEVTKMPTEEDIDWIMDACFGRHACGPEKAFDKIRKTVPFRDLVRLIASTWEAGRQPANDEWKKFLYHTNASYRELCDRIDG